MPDEWYEWRRTGSPIRDWIIEGLKKIGRGAARLISGGRISVSDLSSLVIGSVIVGVVLMTLLGVTWKL
jgi:hypothetical protein